MAETAKAITTLELGAEGGFQIPVSLKKIRQTQDVSLDTATAGGTPTGTKPVDLMTGKLLEEVDLPLKKGVYRYKPKKTDKTTWSDFVEILPEDLAVIDDATHIENFVIDHFIPLKDVPFERVMDAYFLAPADGHNVKPLVLLAKVLRKTKKAGAFKLVKTSRQYLAVVYEKDGGLIVNTLAYAGDFAAVREAAEALERQGTKVKPAEVEMGVQLIETLAADADVLDSFEDDLIPLKADLVERALKGQELPKRARKAQTPVADDGLEARLRESIAQASSKGKAPVGVG